MDVNSVLQNTRQYFQGIPSSSPASGELAPGASVGYSSPPVSSTATSIAASASGPGGAAYGATIPFTGGRFAPPPATWSPQPASSSQNVYSPHLAPVSVPAANGQRFGQAVVGGTPYPHHFYERSAKALPSTSNSSFVPQHAYPSPSITRLKEQGGNNQGMFNMDSIVCQTNASYPHGSKKIKTKMPSSPANVYKQPTQLEDSRYFNHHPSPPTLHPMHSQPSTPTRVPAVLPHVSLPSHQRPHELPVNHQAFSHQSVIEQRVGFQQQVSYHASSIVRTSSTTEKVTAAASAANQPRSTAGGSSSASNAVGTGANGEPVDVRYYVNRRVETTALQSTPALSKRDSPLDLSVKTIRQSADSTAHDDENAAVALYNHHHLQQQNVVAGYPPIPSMRPADASRHSSHLPQLPYAVNAATAAVSVPNLRNHSSTSAFTVTQRAPHYPPPANPSPAVYSPEIAPYWNGQIQEHDKAVRHPVSEFRHQKTTFSVTIEQKQRIHRTQVNAEVSSMRFSSSHHIYQPQPQHQTPPPASDAVTAAKVKSQFTSVNQMLAEKNFTPNAPAKLAALPAPPSNPAPGSSRKKRPSPEAAGPPAKNPRVSLEWRENIDKEIENRLNAYTSMKAREQQEQEATKSYREIVPSGGVAPLASSPTPADSVLRTNLEKDKPAPFTQYLEQKAQHKLPVQPIHAFSPWYQQRPVAGGAQSLKASRPEPRVAYPDNHAVSFSKSNFESGDLKVIEKVELKHEPLPLPPFRAFTQTSSVSPDKERSRKGSASEKQDEAEAEARKSNDEDGQSREALMASAAAHPRIRTKAELKQVTPVDKSKNKANAETKPDAKLPEAQSKKIRSHFNPVGPKLFANAKGFGDNDSHHRVNHKSAKSTFDPEGDLLSPESPSNLIIDLGNQFSPRKRLLSRSERNGINVHGSSSETTVFDFRSSDSESENNAGDVHSLNDMRRKDRKTRTPSGTPPTVIDQFNDELADDSKWLEACDELIQQFSGAGQKKRGRKKKPGGKFGSDDDRPAHVFATPPPPPPILARQEDRKQKDSDSEDDKPLVMDKIKKEAKDEPYTETSAPVLVADAEPPALAAVRVKKEQIEDEGKEKQEDEDDEDDEESEEEESEASEEDETEDSEDSEQSTDSDSSYEATPTKFTASKEAKRRGKFNGTVELRDQRSNVSTTRIRIQNSLEEGSSEAESSDTDDSYKAPVKKTPLRKAKLVVKKKKMPKSKIITRKKIDPRREKVRHMMLRRMETRKSRLDALKAAKASKAKRPRNDSSSSEEQQPIMTRKMTRQECQREKSRMEEARKKPASKKTPDDKGKSIKVDDKTKSKSDRPKDDKTKAKEDRSKKDKNDEKSKPKPDEKSKPKDKVKPKEKSGDESTPKAKSGDDKSSKSTPVKEQKSDKDDSKKSPAKKDDKIKKNDKSKKTPVKVEPKEPIEDVTRRSLRSRNVIVVNDEKNSPSKKSPAKKADPAKSKSPVKSKNEDKKKSEIKEEKMVKPSWEEELFNYKYSLRMPVKLINIAKPPNWPKNSGGASSLPDLDRDESDSDLLNEHANPKMLKKRNKDETKVSNTKEFKDSVKYLKEKFDKKIEEHKATSLTQLMIEKKIKIIPKSSDGPELLPTPSLDSLRSKLNSKNDSPKKNNAKKSKDAIKADDDEKEDIVEDKLIGYFRKETVDVFKEVFEKHQVANQFKTVILESRTRTQTKEMKHNATLKQVFGCDRPASAPPVSDSIVEDDDKKVKNSTNGCLKGWKSFAKFKLLMEQDSCRDGEKNKDFEDTVDFVYNDVSAVSADVAEGKDNNEVEIENVVKRKNRSFRRKCRSSGFDYIRKKKKHKKEEDEEIDDKERKKVVTAIRPTPESIEDIQNEIKSWVVNKGIGETVLHKAARLGYSDISSYCLEKLNCAPSPTDNAGYTPLHEACTRGHLKIAKMLLKYGADVSASAKGGIRPLHEAVEHGNIELVRLLLAYGADPLLSTYAGQTPLSLVKEDQEELREFLTLYLADIQGNPAKPWMFLGCDEIDEEKCGYYPLIDSPPPSPEQVASLEMEISDTPLPTLYRFKNDAELWMLCSDLPTKVRDAVSKRHQQDHGAASQYIIKKITKTEFDENIECASFLEYKFPPKLNKSKSNMYTLVKYNEKLMTALNIKKLTMSFS